MLTRRPVLKGLAAFSAAAGLGKSAPVWAQQSAKIHYGWDAQVEAPTQATFYVSPDGNDRNAGSLHAPVRSIQRGVDLLARQGKRGVQGGSLAIRGGLYREAVDLDALRGTAEAPVRIHRYGRERVTISAAESLTGWQPCTEAQARALGTSPQGLYVAHFRSSDLLHSDINALNLHDGGVWRSIAVDRADTSDPERAGDRFTYHEGAFSIDAQDRILSIRDPRLKNIAPALIAETKVLLYHRPNLVSVMAIAKYDPARAEILLANPNPRLQGSRERPVMLYALQGASWMLTPGTWVARKTRRSISVYYRPEDGQSPEGRIEVSVRPSCLSFGHARHVELLGLEALRAAGSKGDEGAGIGGVQGKRDPTAGVGLRLSHCRIGETLSTRGRGAGTVVLRHTKDLRLSHLSVGPARGGYGLAVHNSTGMDARFVHVDNTSNSPVRFFTLQHSVLAFSLFENAGWDAHSNKLNFYQGSDAILVYGIRCANVRGYATFQKASRIYFAFCDLPCDPMAKNRALVAQNFPPGSRFDGPDGTGEPVTNSTFYYWNNSMTAPAGETSAANALMLGPKNTNQTHAFFNNILHGGGFPSIYTHETPSTRERRSHNRYTGLSFWQKARYGWTLGPGEAMLPVGAKPRAEGRDMRPQIAEVAPLFPTFTDWDLDVGGNKVDWTRPPIGAQV